MTCNVSEKLRWNPISENDFEVLQGIGYIAADNAGRYVGGGNDNNNNNKCQIVLTAGKELIQKRI